METLAETDELDFRIVQRLVLGGGAEPRMDRAGAEEIAHALDVHPNTVAARIRKMTKHDVLLPMTIQVQAPVVGLELAHVFFPVPRERRTDALVAAFRGMPGLQHFVQYAEGWTCAVYGRSLQELQQMVGVFEEKAGVEAVWDMVSTRDWPSVPPIEVDATNARILGHLVANARAGIPAAATALRMPVRTLRFRLERLAQAKAIRYIPGGAGRPLGMTRGYVIFELAEKEKRKQAVEAAPRALRDYWTGRVFERWGHFWIYGRDPEGMMRQVSQLAQVPGVSNVRCRVMEAFEVPKSFPVWLTRALTPPRP